METQVNKFPNPLMWIVGVAITLFCAAGIAAIMGWIPASMGGPGYSAALTKLEKHPASTNKPTAAKAHAAPEARTAPVQVASGAPVAARCAECGVIESTREIATSGEGTGLGAAGGAVVGGLLGHQVGGGRGQQVATVVGVVGGAVAGNEVEKRVKSTKSYEVTVRMDDGSTRVIHEASAPTWRAGDQVKVVDGVIRSI